MKKITLLLIAGVLGVGLSKVSVAAPNVLAYPASIDGACAGQTTAAVNATAGASTVNNPIFLDYDTSVTVLVNDMSNVSASTIHSLSNGAGVNHAPYLIGHDCLQWNGNQAPLEGGTIGAATGTTYAAAVASGGVVVAPGPSSGTNSALQQLNASIMTVTSPDSGDANRGTGGYGLEFFLSTSYLGLTTNTDSADVGNLSGIAAAVAFAHSGYNAFDVHAALRQTASGWSNGWTKAAGYGTVNYSTASGSISTVYLQPPNMVIQNLGYYAQITLYPFRTTRRVKEVVYIGGTWPAASAGNELTAAQIAAAGGTLIYTSNGTDVIPQFSYAPAASGTATFYALTLDASGNGSRIELYEATPETFVVGTSCGR